MPSKLFIRGRKIALTMSMLSSFAKAPHHRQLNLLHGQRVRVVPASINHSQAA